MRLPQKALLEINGIPMLEHVWRRARTSIENENLFIATSDQKIRDRLRHLQINWFQSRQMHQNGTSRVIEFLKSNEIFDYVVVLQGDEPLIDPTTLSRIFHAMKSSTLDALNVVSPLQSREDLSNHNVVKCFLNINNEIYFMFRNNPFIDSTKVPLNQIKAIRGLFAFNRSLIPIFNSLDEHSLASTESVEQFTLIEKGSSIGGLLENKYYPSVNTKQELELVTHCMNTDPAQKYYFKQSLEF